MATQLTPNFTQEEFMCPCGCGGYHISFHLVGLLQELRDKVGRPVYVSQGGGFRCPAYNATLPRASATSQHLNGLAADINVKDMDVVTLWRICLLEPRFTGLGFYPSHVHVDIRPGQRVFWSSK